MAVKTKKKKTMESSNYVYKNKDTLDKDCKIVIDKSEKDNPLQGRVNTLLSAIDEQVLEYEPKGDDETFTATQLKEINSIKAQLKRLKFKSEALKARGTRALLNAGEKLEIKERPHNWYILKNMVDAENKSTITKRRKSSANTAKLTADKKVAITKKMQELKRFTITDSEDEEASLAFNKNSEMEKFSRSQLDGIVKTQIKMGYLVKAKDKQGKAQIFEKKK